MTPILLLLIFPLLLTANPAADQEIDQDILYCTFNGEWAKADSLLDAQIGKYPSSVKYYAMKCPFYFYTRYFSGGVLPGDSLIQKMAEYAQKAIDVSEDAELSLEERFFLGTAHAYQARYYGRQGELWNAYWAARAALSNLGQVLEEDPDFVDAYQEKAVMDYFTAVNVTGFYGAVAWVVGMKGDRDEALQMFHLVAEKGNYCKYEAQFALSAIYRFIAVDQDYQQAKDLNDKLLVQFPDNPWMALRDTELHFLILVEEKGVDFLATEFDSLTTKYGVTNPGMLNTLGYNLVNNGRMEDALEVFKLNIRLFPDIANGYDSLSEAYETAENYEMAVKYAELCLEKIDADSTINDQFREILREANTTRVEAYGDEVGNKINT
jgi:tetratricopeptide (TPR) repeat protein